MEANAASITPETAVQPSTPSADTTNNMLANSQADNTVSVSTKEYELLQQLLHERRENGLKEKARRHSKVMSSRRITVALRRIDLKTIAPDNDVVAYIEVCNLHAVAGEKAEATDKEMAAYLDLYFAGNDNPTLEQIKAALI